MGEHVEIIIGRVTNRRGERRWTARAYRDSKLVWSSEEATTVRSALRELAEPITRVLTEED